MLLFLLALACTGNVGDTETTDTEVEVVEGIEVDVEYEDDAFTLACEDLPDWAEVLEGEAVMGCREMGWYAGAIIGPTGDITAARLNNYDDYDVLIDTLSPDSWAEIDTFDEDSGAFSGQALLIWDDAQALLTFDFSGE